MVDRSNCKRGMVSLSAHGFRGFIHCGWEGLVHCSRSPRLRLLTFWKAKKQRGNLVALGFFSFIPSDPQLMRRCLLHSEWVSYSS